MALLLGGALLLGLSASAHAAKGTIRLFAASDTYTPGKPVTIYVYFFRVSSMGFWGQNIRSVPDFQVRSRKRISGRVERSRDPSGSPFPIEHQHLLYRVSLMPRSQAATLRYGPLKLAFQVGSFSGFRRVVLRSNSLVFKRSKATNPGQKIKTSTLLPKGKITEGLPFPITYEVQCPTSLCNYQKIGHSRLRQILQGRVKIDPPDSLSLPQTSVEPEITYQQQNQPPTTTLRFRYKAYPLRKGSITTPSFSVSLPVLSVVDQRPILKRIHKWLVSKGISSRRAPRYVQMDRDIQANLTLRKLSWQRRSFQAQPSPGLQGQWQLKSQLVTNDGKTYWKLSLEGKGLLRAVVSYFRQQLTELLDKHKLTSQVTLAHQSWELPDGRPDGRIALHAFFQFKGSQAAIPAMQMRFVDPKGATYTRTTVALAANATASVNDTTPMSGSGKQRKIYIHHYTAPTVDQAQQVTIWGVSLPNGFPTKQLLAQRWTFESPLQLKEQQVGTIHRSYSRRVRDPFTGGVTFMQYSGPSPVEAEVGSVQASVRKGILSVIPAVRWGNQWIFHHRKASKASQQGLVLKASTDRKRYFSGEKVEYKLVVKCPKRICTEEVRRFFEEQIFQKFKLIKLPSFTKFAEPQIIERLKQYVVGDNIEFRFRASFKAPSASEFKIKAATLRLPRRFQYHILQQFGTCLFPEGGSRSILFRLVAKDHYQRDINNRGRCSIGTQILSSSALTVPIEALPDQAKGIQLIGTFRVAAKLSQMTFPNKNTTIADKPFYLNVTVSGDGDLKTARELLRDQLSGLARTLRKRNVTSYIETPTDKGADGSLSLQVQLIGEEAGKFTIPSLKLKYYHREEGVLTAQTLPIKVTITPRVGGAAAIPIARRAPGKKPKRTLQSTTDLRPNRVLGAHFAASTPFSFDRWYALLLLLGGPGLFLLFLGWHRIDLSRSADPQRAQRNRALRQFSSNAQEAKRSFGNDAKAGARASIDAIQRYFIERLSLSQKQLTAPEIEELLTPHTDSEASKAAAKELIQQLDQLEASLYGGAPIGDPGAFLSEIEQRIRTLDKALPKTKGGDK